MWTLLECIGKETGQERYSTARSDIWSLGIILVNMICGRNPWKLAVSTDDCFSAFLYDPHWIPRVLPISKAAHILLKRILVINPLDRVTLSELRREVLLIDNFFQTEAEKRSLPPPPRKAPRRSITKRVWRFFPRSSSSAEVSSSVSCPGTPTQNTGRTDRPKVKQSSHPSSSETGSSGGPVTPATNAVEPDIEVPDLDEDENIGESIRQHHNHNIFSLHRLKIDGKSPRHQSGPADHDKPLPSRILRKAVRRFKAISASPSSP
jgi:serine/threonine protein kinase